jgi:hypothetical protein
MHSSMWVHPTLLRTSSSLRLPGSFGPAARRPSVEQKAAAATPLSNTTADLAAIVEPSVHSYHQTSSRSHDVKDARCVEVPGGSVHGVVSEVRSVWLKGTLKSCLHCRHWGSTALDADRKVELFPVAEMHTSAALS